MENNDLTTEILKEIRNAVLGTNVRLDQTNRRLDQTIVRLDETNGHLEEQTERLDRRITESEVRTATAINQLRGTMEDVKELLGPIRTKHAADC
jgi:predicted RNase H-like nuclease (RuvC/YqgF family)